MAGTESATTIPAVSVYGFCQSLNNSVWKNLPRSGGLIPDMWEQASSSLKEICEGKSPSNVKIGKKEVVVTIPARAVASEGFVLNGSMPFCFDSGARAGVKLTFKIEKSHGKTELIFNEGEWSFTRPILAQANLDIPGGGGFLNLIGWKSYESLANDMKIKAYDPSKAGDLERPVALAIDHMTITSKRSKTSKELKPAIYPKGKQGSFVFGSDKKECKGKADETDRTKPGEFLGEGLCRYTELGPRTYEILLAWVLKDITRLLDYNRFFFYTGKNPALAMMILSNMILGSGIGSQKCNLTKLKEEHQRLNKAYQNLQELIKKYLK